MVSGDATEFIKKWADSKDVELLSMDLHSIDDIRGERVIVTDAPTPYYYDRYWWLDMANEHPNKNHLMIFYVEEADTRAIYALESFIEHKPDNLFYGIINRNPDKTINYSSGGNLSDGAKSRPKAIFKQADQEPNEMKEWNV